MALYDPDYESWFDRLKSPDMATIEEIHQEKQEALSLVALSLADLESIKDSLNASDYEDLHKRLRVHHYALRAWTWVAEILWVRYLDDNDGMIRYASTACAKPPMRPKRKWGKPIRLDLRTCAVSPTKPRNW